MSFLLVPHKVTDTTATIWVAADNENVRTKSVGLEFHGNGGGSEVVLDASEWQTWRSRYPLDRRLLNRFPFNRLKPEPQPRRLYYQRVTVGPLNPRTSYSLRLRVDGRMVVFKEGLEVRVTTLPTTLPAEEEKPFTLLLGSCFYRPNDQEGMVGKTYQNMPKDERPDIKGLCGDQVYLDNPWIETTLKWWLVLRSPYSFRETLLNKYLDNWTPDSGNNAGLWPLLRDGANYFCSDDHEFWNNAPNIGGVALPHTLFRFQREWYFGAATNLFHMFQSVSPFAKFEINPLSFCIVDTRINRDIKSRGGFIDDHDLEAVAQWVDNLQGPGVLVVGQPVLAERKSSILSYLNFWSFFDKNLADYAQCEKLIELLKRSRHSLALLTGDVHYGRVSHFELNSSLGTELVEVISSPMSVVSGFWNKPEFGKYKPAPELFSRKIADIPFYERNPCKKETNHFVTIEFRSAGDAGVNVKVKYWPIPHPGEPLPSKSDVVLDTNLD